MLRFHDTAIATEKQHSLSNLIATKHFGRFDRSRSKTLAKPFHRLGHFPFPATHEARMVKPKKPFLRSVSRLT
jgi:hypothetical protein